MKKSPLFLAGFFIIILITACSPDDGRSDIRDFYFPLKSLTEGLVYEYQPVGTDTSAPVYWYYQSFLQPDSNFFTGTYYEQDLIPLQLTREEVVSNGMLLEDINLYLRDTFGQQTRIQGEILSGSVFPFMVEENGGIFLYKVRFDFPNAENYSTTVIKNRYYVGDTTYTLSGNTYPAVVFEVKELIEHGNEEAGYAEPELEGTEIYAKGIGLVYYDKGPKEGERIAYELQDRYPMADLKAKLRKMEGQ